MRSGDGIEQKIVESAIVFWFKDADCKAENKVVEYLTLSFCLYCKYFTYTSKNNLFTML
jgi:hypothetical protein